MTAFDKAATGGALVLLHCKRVWQWIVGLLDCGIAGLQGCYSAVTVFDKAATGGAAHFNTKRVVQLRPKGGVLPFNAERDCVWQWIVGLLGCGIAGLWDCWIAGLLLCCDCI